MTGEEAPAHDRLAEALLELRRRFGPDAFDNRRRLVSLLADAVPEAKRDIRLIGSALDERVHEALGGAERHLLGMEMDRQAKRLESGTGLRIDIAQQIVRTLAYALELGPLPSVYIASIPIPTPAGPTPDAWAGLSQPVGGDAPPAHTVTQPHSQRREPVVPKVAKSPWGKLEGKQWIVAAAALVGILASSQLIGGKDQPPVQPVPGAGGGQPTQQPVQAADSRGFAGELTDHGVAAKRALESNVGSPTPLDIPVGKRLTTGEVQKLIAADSSSLLVDVLANPHPMTIRNAVHLPAVGLPGSIDDATQAEVVRQLAALTAGNPARPLIFFCAGAICWESYNAALRADAAGMRNVNWYRGGLASWAEAGLPMQPLQPAAPAPAGQMSWP